MRGPGRATPQLEPWPVTRGWLSTSPGSCPSVGRTPSAGGVSGPAALTAAAKLQFAEYPLTSEFMPCSSMAHGRVLNASSLLDTNPHLSPWQSTNLLSTNLQSLGADRPQPLHPAPCSFNALSLRRRGTTVAPGDGGTPPLGSRSVNRSASMSRGHPSSRLPSGRVSVRAVHALPLARKQ